MPAEAEATDILVKVIFEGAEFFLRMGGNAATKGVSFLCALAKLGYERTKGHQKLGGKITSRKFIENFTASSIFPLSKEDFEKLKPELKRLNIVYMQYKQTKDMKNDGIVEISVRKEDADRFIRCAENLGIASVSPYDIQATELSEEEYTQALEKGGAKGVNVTVTENGITVNETANPTQAPTDPLNQSEQNSNASNPFSQYDMVFDPDKSIANNLENAELVAARRNGTLIPISADRDSLLISESKDDVVLTVPGTKKSERIRIPREDVISTQGNGGKSVIADLKHDKVYDILDKNNKPIRKMSGSEIGAEGKWNNAYAPRKRKPKVPVPTKEGTK